MTEFSHIPSELLLHLENKGFMQNDMRIALKTDRDVYGMPCDTYVFATDEHIICIGGVVEVRTEKFRRAKNKPLHCGFTETYYRVFDISEISRVSVDMTISGISFSESLG